MSNVRTLKDLEAGPNRQPLPNPWQAYPNASRSSPYTTGTYSSDYGGASGGADYTTSMRYQYVGFDGYPHEMNVATRPTMTQMCCGT